jgi:hypothetical protein
MRAITPVSSFCRVGDCSLTLAGSVELTIS